MASITIRNLDEDLKARLRLRAARHGRSMEDEVREIVRQSLAQADETPRDLGERLHRRFAAVGGVELELPAREPMPEPPDLSG